MAQLKNGQGLALLAYSMGCVGAQEYIGEYLPTKSRQGGAHQRHWQCEAGLTGGGEEMGKQVAWEEMNISR